MFKDFFKKYEPDGIKKLSKARKKNIKAAVFERINESEPVCKKRFKLRPAIVAAAATAAVITGAAVGALSSPPEVTLNGDIIVPRYNVYTDTDGAMVEIITVELPPEMLKEEVPGMTTAGELRLKRSELGDIPRDDNFDVWLIDENGDEYYGCVNNNLINIKITYPSKATSVHNIIPCNLNTENNYSYSTSIKGYEILFLPHQTEVCGRYTEPRYYADYDYEHDAVIEIMALKLPPEALGEPVPDCDFPSVVPSELIMTATAVLFDDEGNKITPVLTDTIGSAEFPDGVNDLLVEIKVTYSDGSVETTRLDPINKLEGFNCDDIEFNYSIAKYENMLDNDPWIVEGSED